MFKLYANKTQLTVRQREPITSGSVNVYTALFEFSDDWTGMDRVAVFQGAAGAPVSVLLDKTGICTVPWEVLTKPYVQLKAGVYGTIGGEVVLPTIWASLGTILEGVPGDSKPTPTPALWEQALSGRANRIDYTEKGELGIFADNKLLSSVPVISGGGEGGGMQWGIGNGLKIVSGELTVDTTDNFQGDNTLPMTAAGVETVVGNIEALLGVI